MSSSFYALQKVHEKLERYTNRRRRKQAQPEDPEITVSGLVVGLVRRLIWLYQLNFYLYFFVYSQCLMLSKAYILSTSWIFAHFFQAIPAVFFF